MKNSEITKRIKSVVVFFLLAVISSSCDTVEEVLASFELSDSEIVEGLKEALELGAETATNQLSLSDGYLKDEAVKLLLPSEISTAILSLKEQTIDIPLLGSINGDEIYSSGIPLLGIEPLSSLENDLIVGINRAAETAAKDAGPIFLDAITNISIEDGSTILFGGVDTAATVYLEDKTRGLLFDEYEPKIDAALSSVKIGESSVVNVYEDYITKYNDILNTKTSPLTPTIGELMGVPALSASDLSSYATEKGLKGLFLKVGDQEKMIRTNPLSRVTDVLTKVFSKLDE